MNHTEKIDVRMLIDQQGMSATQWLIIALCFGIVAADGIDVAIMGFLAPEIIADWGITKAAFGLIMGAAPFGLVFGALFAGPMSDRIGRKTVLVTAVAIFGVLTLITAFSNNPTQMAILRFLTGIGLGAAMPNTTTLIAEFVPEKRKSFLITVMFLGFAIGSAGVGFIAAYLTPLYGWHTVLMFGGILPLVLLPLLIVFLPESVRFMLLKGQSQDKIRRTLNRISQQVLSPQAEFFCTEPVQSKKPLGVLFTPSYFKTTLALWLTYFMGLLVIYLITSWLPTMMKDAGLSIKQAANITALFQTGGIIGALSTGWLMDKFKPTKIIAIGYALGAACIVVLGMGGVLSSSLGVWVFAAGVCMNGAQTGLNAFAPTCYPTAARATGVSWMQGMGRFGSILGSSIGGALVGMGWGFTGIITCLAIPALAAGAAVLMGKRIGDNNSNNTMTSAPSVASKSL